MNATSGAVSSSPRAATGLITKQSLVRDYEHSRRSAGKHRYGTGRRPVPWNDSSVFSVQPRREPAVHGDRLPEKSGYGSKAAAPVVKCISPLSRRRGAHRPRAAERPARRQLAVHRSPKALADDSCLGGYDGSVRE
ncbi:MAG: hypothetical protein R2713_02475 [Ilumatobacteraceae bacterium]